MELLCVSDIHLQKQNIVLLREKLVGKHIDAVIVAGDFTTNGSEFAAEEIFKELKLIGKVFAVPGNSDNEKVLAVLENKGANIHNRILQFREYNFVGFGGGLLGGPGKINFSEKEIEKNLSGLLQDNFEKTILVTHLPPFGTSLDNPPGTKKHCGSKAIKKIIEEKQPLLHLCGHCHEAQSEELLGKTLSINISALKDGKAVLLSLNGRIKFERIELFL